MQSPRDIALQLLPQHTYGDLLQAADDTALRLYGNNHAGPRKVMKTLRMLVGDEQKSPEALLEILSKL